MTRFPDIQCSAPSAHAVVAAQAHSMRRLNVLTERETDVLELLGMSFSNRSIARVLGISAGTVKRHLRNIHPRLGGTRKEQVPTRARTLRLIHPVLPGQTPYEVDELRGERLRRLAQRVDAVMARRQ